MYIQKPYARRAWYDPTHQLVMVELANRSVLGWPWQLLQGLEAATQAQLEQVELSPGGYGLQWPELDADLYIPGLKQGIYGTAAWMRRLKQEGLI